MSNSIKGKKIILMGVTGVLGRSFLDFFVKEHAKIVIADKKELSESWFKEDIVASLKEVSVEWISPNETELGNGIVSISIGTLSGVVIID